MDMGTDMVMATVTANKNRLLWRRALVALVAVAPSVIATELTLTPQVFATSTYSDNVTLAADGNEESSWVSTLGAGLSSQLELSRGFVALTYTARQILYSYESERNEFYNELYFDAEKELGRSGFYVDSAATISQISRGADENSLTDYISGDTVEQQIYRLGMGYKNNNPTGYLDLNLYASTSAVRNEDDLAENDGQFYSLRLVNGRAEKRFFWTYNLGYRITGSNRSDNENTSEIHRAEFGLQARHGFSPFVQFYREVYKQDISGTTTRENNRIGPALRYYWSRSSYIEANYNFDLDDEFNDADYAGAALLIQPSQRTRLSADYSKRFYGDAFSVALSHRTRRLSNTLSYNEDAVSYNRDFYQSGNNLEAFRLEKRLQWDSQLTLRRTSYRLSLNRTENSSFSDFRDEREDIRYQASLTASRWLKRTLSASLQLAYEDYQFESQQIRQRNDEYMWAELRMQFQLVAGLNLGGGVRVAERTSEFEFNEFQENRIYLNISKRF